MMRAEQQKEFASLAVTNSWQLMRLHIVIVVVRQLEHWWITFWLGQCSCIIIIIIIIIVDAFVLSWKIPKRFIIKAKFGKAIFHLRSFCLFGKARCAFQKQSIDLKVCFFSRCFIGSLFPILMSLLGVWEEAACTSRYFLLNSIWCFFLSMGSAQLKNKKAKKKINLFIFKRRFSVS